MRSVLPNPCTKTVVIVVVRDTSTCCRANWEIYVSRVFACLQECVFASVYQTSEGMRVMLTSPGRSQSDSLAGDVAHVLWLIWFVHLLHIWHYFILNYFQLIPVGFSENSPLLCLYLRYCCCKRSKSVTKMELSCQECSCFHVSPSWTCLSAPAWLRRCYLELHQPSRWQIKAPGRSRTAYHQQHMLAHTMLH